MKGSLIGLCPDAHTVDSPKGQCALPCTLRMELCPQLSHGTAKGLGGPGPTRAPRLGAPQDMEQAQDICGRERQDHRSHSALWGHSPPQEVQGHCHLLEGLNFSGPHDLDASKGF